MKKFFRFSDYDTNYKKEIMAGIITFLSVAYILGVNVSILSASGLSSNAVFFATAISAAISTIFMGIYANAPIALAPGLGLNAFFTYTIVHTYQYKPYEALALVFLSGVAFLLISVCGLRKTIMDAIPHNLKQAISAAIGFFIAFLGLNKMGIIVDSPATLVTIGSLKNPTVLLGLFGLFLALVLMSRKYNSAIFVSLFLTAIIGVVLGKFGIQGMPNTPTQIISSNFDTSAVGIFFSGLKSVITRPETFVIVFTLLFVDFFDTAGTLIAVSGKITDKSGKEYDMNKMFYSDAIGTIAGSMLGTSNVTSFVESITGVSAGGRTGFSAVVTGVLFLFATLFSPLLKVVESIQVDGRFLDPVTAPTLVIVGILMATQLSNVDWHDFTASASGFMTIIVMILSYSIADGIASGFIVYVITKLASKKAKEISPTLWVLFFVFILHFSINK